MARDPIRLARRNARTEREIPDNVDLRRFDDLVIYCIPFTTRIATAELR